MTLAETCSVSKQLASTSFCRQLLGKLLVQQWHGSSGSVRLSHILMDEGWLQIKNECGVHGSWTKIRSLRYVDWDVWNVVRTLWVRDNILCSIRSLILTNAAKAWEDLINVKNCCFITMCKAHIKVTHIKQQIYFHHLKCPGYNTEFLLYPRPFRW